MKSKIFTTGIVIATIILAGVAIFTAYRLYQLRQEPVTPTISEAASGWDECNGYDQPGYDKFACRNKAIKRADREEDWLGGKDFYDFGLPIPPSGNKTSTVEVPNASVQESDQAWYNWGITDLDVPRDREFLSHDTACGLGPEACVDPTITPPETEKIACTPLTFTLTPPEPDLACLGDQVIYDENQDGIQDPDEEGVLGIPVMLYDSTDELVDEATTNSTGNYQFCDLEPGEYYVAFTIDSKYTTSPYKVGSDECKDSDANISTGVTESVALAAGDNYMCLDALIYEPDVTSTPTPTPTPTDDPDPSATPTDTPGSTATPTDAPVSSNPTIAPDPELPEAGVGMPTIFATGAGLLILMLSFALVL